MLAVLPFDNLSGDPEQEYFSDGMTEEMIAQLGRLQPARLGVIARTSAMHYKGTDKRVDEIGRELGVDYILEGSVRREAERVRITAQLIQVSDQTHLWAQSYERELAGMFAIQSEVSRRIARSLEVELLPAQQARLPSARSVDPQAYEAYLKGRYYWNKRTREGLEKGLEYFQQAIEIDPGYALGHVGVADTYGILGDNNLLPPEETFPKARAAALKALEIDENLAEAHTSLALVIFGYDWDWEGTEQEYKLAVKLNPSYATAHHWYGMFLSNMGRHEEAIAEIRKARELDPLSPRINANVGRVLYFARRYDQAIEELKKALELHPNNMAAVNSLADAYWLKEMYDEAIATFERGRIIGGASAEEVAALREAYAEEGTRGVLRLWLKEAESRRTEGHLVPPLGLAGLHVGLGETDQAFAWLEKGYAERDYDMTLLRVYPFFDPIREDPRFQSLLRRLNFPE